MKSDDPCQLIEPVTVNRSALEVFSSDTPRVKGRWIVEPKATGWDDYALSEWELTRAGMSDYHPHDEVTFVLEGELHIRVDETTVVGRPGDTITVPAGSTGHYWAPTYARMLGIYGPNPDGAASEYLDYWEIDDQA